LKFCLEVEVEVVSLDLGSFCRGLKLCQSAAPPRRWVIVEVTLEVEVVSLILFVKVHRVAEPEACMGGQCACVHFSELMLCVYACMCVRFVCVCACDRLIMLFGALYC
jgi:hypothetical protein